MIRALRVTVSTEGGKEIAEDLTGHHVADYMSNLRNGHRARHEGCWLLVFEGFVNLYFTEIYKSLCYVAMAMSLYPCLPGL